MTDPLGEKYPQENPYSYAGNNPILFIDKDGRVKVNCTNVIAADGSTASLTTVDPSYIQSIGYGPQWTPGYSNNYQIDYDVFTTTTVDYSNMVDGKPTISSNVKLKEHSSVLEAKANLLNQKSIVTKELGDPAGNTDDPFGQFTGNTNPVVSPNAQSGNNSDGKQDRTEPWQTGDSGGGEVNKKSPNSNNRVDTAGHYVYTDKKTGDTVEIRNKQTQEVVKKGSEEYKEFNNNLQE